MTWAGVVLGFCECQCLLYERVGNMAQSFPSFQSDICCGCMLLLCVLSPGSPLPPLKDSHHHDHRVSCYIELSLHIPLSDPNHTPCYVCTPSLIHPHLLLPLRPGVLLPNPDCPLSLLLLMRSLHPTRCYLYSVLNSRTR